MAYFHNTAAGGASSGGLTDAQLRATAITVTTSATSVEGTTTDAAVTTDANGTINAHIRGLVAWTALSTQIDYASTVNPTYVGRAVPGTATSAAGWQIRKFTYDGSNNPLTALFASGSPAFTAVWDSRAGLTYS